MSSYPLRPVAADELSDFFTALMRAFGNDWRDDELAAVTLTAEPERSLAAFDGGRIVGTAGAFTFDLAVPGARLPAAGVTYVGVAATHRRRGLLTSMMDRQLADIHERGEPVAALWASEASIYGRFGYGIASQKLAVEVDRVDTKLRADAPRDPELELVDLTGDEVLPALAAVEGAVEDLGRSRPGEFRRDERWLRLLLHDPEWRRDGFSSLQCVVARRGGDVHGYVLFRTKPKPLRPYLLNDGEVSVVAQRTLTPAANSALTAHLLATDLMRRVRWWNLPIDTALPHLLADPRQAKSILTDALHLRVVDVPAALAGRRYATPIDVVLEVVDPRCPWNDGRWHLCGDSNSAACTATKAAPALRLDVEALGAAYLGGTSMATLAAAGRIESPVPAVLRDVSVAFGWDRRPWCPVIF